MRATVALALERFGRLDILVNNAARGMKYVSEDFMTEPTRFWETPAGTWRLVIDTNVVGPFLMARAVVPTMLTGGWGRIINISINADTMRRRGFSPYGPSKAALESATTIWAQDLVDTGVTVNALLPGGPTLTGMIPSRFPSHLHDEFWIPRSWYRLFFGSRVRNPMASPAVVLSRQTGAKIVQQAPLLVGRLGGMPASLQTRKPLKSTKCRGRGRSTAVDDGA